MLPKPGTKEETDLILTAMKLPAFVEVTVDALVLGSRWPEMTAAAALLSRMVWWPQDPGERTATKAVELAPCRLTHVKRIVDVKHNRAACLWTLKCEGRTGPDLLMLRRWLHMGMLHTNKEDYRSHLSNLLDIYSDAVERARTTYEGFKEVKT